MGTIAGFELQGDRIAYNDLHSAAETRYYRTVVLLL